MRLSRWLTVCGALIAVASLFGGWIALSALGIALTVLGIAGSMLGAVGQVLRGAWRTGGAGDLSRLFWRRRE